MIQKFVFSILLSFALITSCKNSQINHNFKDSDLIVSLERTPCFGKCPIYLISVDQNGVVRYDAKKFCDTTGVFCFKLNKSEFKMLKNMVNDVNFSSISEKYPENTVVPVDLPSIRLNLVQKNLQKQVLLQGGAIESAPQILKKIVEKVDGFKEKSTFYKCMAN